MRPSIRTQVQTELNHPSPTKRTTIYGLTESKSIIRRKNPNTDIQNRAKNNYPIFKDLSLPRIQNNQQHPNNDLS